MSKKVWERAKWIGLPLEEIHEKNIYHGDLTGRFAYFRCEQTIYEQASLKISITACSRYRLWVNGKSVLSGPCKGDMQRHFYETLDVTDYLINGKNVFAMQVLYCDPNTVVSQSDERASIFGVNTPLGGHRAAVEGEIIGANGREIGTVTTGIAEWKVYLDNSFYLKSNDITLNLGAVCEEIDFRRSPGKWKENDYPIMTWKNAEILEEVNGSAFTRMVGLRDHFPIKERPIPLMEEINSYFEKEISNTGTWEVLQRDKKIHISPKEKREFILDASVVKNAYLNYRFENGAGAKLSFTYFEKFYSDEMEMKRDDTNGKIEGITDVIVLDGKVSSYEPFWYRTFRFVRICIETAEEPLDFYDPCMSMTGYPLEIQSYVKSSAEWVEPLWEICVRTLKNCMMETYMDCPYYEQMQFSMDTRLQALFNYSASTDGRLARKALEDFHSSMTPEGLIHGKYPSAYCQIISTFSLHYIYMIWEYYQQTGDLSVLKMYVPDVDRILGYYESKIGEEGLVGNLGYWMFVDWQPKWQESAGVPAAAETGASTIINLMYGYGLLCGAKMNEALNRFDTAEEYKNRQKVLTERIQKLCFDQKQGLFREGPLFEQFSQHAQVWAILNQMMDKQYGKVLLEKSMLLEIQCSFCTSYELFRAMEFCECYELTESKMQEWIRLLELHCTTCPEVPGMARSECHAWSALPMYEMIRAMGGIQLEKPGWEMVKIQPHLEYLPDLSGLAATPKGDIKFHYYKENSEWKYEITMPEGMQGVLITEKGNVFELKKGVHVYR